MLPLIANDSPSFLPTTLLLFCPSDVQVSAFSSYGTLWTIFQLGVSIQTNKPDYSHSQPLQTPADAFGRGLKGPQPS
jgi:hypothetical protein